MKLLTVFVLLFLTSSSLYHVSGHIIIHIEPADLHQIGEILVQHMQEQQEHSIIPRSRSSRSVAFIKISQSVFQLVGILLTLVGANLLTAKLEPFVVHQININKPTITPPEMCNNDFGCDSNMCWRTCNVVDNVSNEQKKDITQSWCYTTSKANYSNYHSCIFSSECSPCWSCVGSCKLN